MENIATVKLVIAVNMLIFRFNVNILFQIYKCSLLHLLYRWIIISNCYIVLYWVDKIRGLSKEGGGGGNLD